MKQLQESALHYCKKTFNIETKIFVRENSHLKRVKVYTIEITDPEEIQVIFQALRLVTNSIDVIFLYSAIFMNKQNNFWNCHHYLSVYIFACNVLIIHKMSNVFKSAINAF